MAVSLKPPVGLGPERMLIYGKEGTGKSNAVLSIARRLPDAQFYVIDTDYSASYHRLMATDFTDVMERGNVEVYVTGPHDWSAIMAAAREIRAKVTPGDWVVADSMSPTWDAVQGWFTEQVHGDSIEEYLLDIRIRRQGAADKQAKGDKKGRVKSLEAFEGWIDWSVINPTYFRLYRELLSHPGHLILTAEADRLGDKETKETRDVYGPLGFKPRGQKKLGFLTHTVLLVSRDREGFYLDTVKDRGREDVEDLDLNDFGKDYLIKIAGWKPTRARV